MDHIGAALAANVANILIGLNWKVVLERLSANRAATSDIVATDPEGRTYVIEVKLGQGRTHFSEVAQVESLARDLRSEDKSSSVTPILLTTREVPASIKGAAQKVGVEIVEASGDSTDVADTVVTYLANKPSPK